MIVELRQYTLHPGARDAFVELFETNFVESQEELGVQVFGTFRDLADPDRFVWLRAFPDMAARRTALEAFYGVPAPAWRDNRDAARTAIATADDVLLLAAEPGWSLPPRSERPPVGAAEVPSSVVVVTVWPGPVDLGVPALVTADEVNTYPALPVRGDRVAVVIGAPPPTDATPLQVLRLQPTPRSALR